MTAAQSLPSTLINRERVSHFTIYQPYYQICALAPSASCAAAIIDLIERKTTLIPDEFISLAYQDFHDELCGMYWLSSIQDNVEWLVGIGYVQRKLNRDDKYGYQRYRLDWHRIASRLSIIAQ